MAGRTLKSTCNRKTARGNLYKKWIDAHRAAIDMMNSGRAFNCKTGQVIEAYKCESCGLWHIGRTSENKTI
jgi:hypothetical protein